jgi:hypothetical protein
MSHRQSNSSNKESNDKSSVYTISSTTTSDEHRSTVDTLTSMSSSITTDDHCVSSGNNDDDRHDRADKWFFWKNRKGTSHPSSKFFCLRSFASKTVSAATSDSSSCDKTRKWEEILDKEFQSLDIDADGYVSVADLQSVLK